MVKEIVIEVANQRNITVVTFVSSYKWETNRVSTLTNCEAARLNAVKGTAL